MYKYLFLSILSFTSMSAYGKSHNGYLVKFTNGKMVRTKLSELYRFDKKLIEYVEPNFIYSKFSIKDKLFSYQWALENFGLNSGTWERHGVPGIDVQALKAWDNLRNEKKIKIAVIDTGIDYKHEDLKENIMINTIEKNGRPGVDDDGNGFVDDIYGYDFAYNDPDPMDKDGHGTHCAGIIGAVHNQLGIRGVINNVEILPLKFLDDEGNGETINAVKAIDYAISRGVDIISNSWGGGNRSQALLDAIKRAKDKGIIFVAAVGNSNSDIDKEKVYPASYNVENVIAVASLNAYGKKSKYSNYGQKTVHVFAPGEDILSTLPGNIYKRKSGTSMAAPLVAGIIGLLISQERHTPVEIRNRIIRTSSRDLSLTIYAHSGLIDANKLLLDEY